MSRLVLASNRGPVTLRDGGGRTVGAAGGMAPILIDALRELDASWVCSASTPAERRGRGVQVNGMRVRFVSLPPEVLERAYNGISNRVLWFLHHALWDRSLQPVFDEATTTAWSAYVRTNRSFARAMVREAGSGGIHMVQDYHLSLVPALLRELSPDSRIAHFTHTPFADLSGLHVLPDSMREELLRGLLGADQLGFHTRRWADNFRRAALELDGVTAKGRSHLSVGGRTVRLGVYPVTPPQDLRQQANAPSILAKRARLQERLAGRALLLRVDRMELSKNILRGFLAYEEFLRRNRKWRGKVVHLALLSPSRADIAEYGVYSRACKAEARRINAELGAPDWRPIEVRVKDDHAEVLAAYGVYDALLVNPVVDGMNLVAMEGPTLNGRNGALILSREAGAFDLLGKHSVGVNPFDIGEQAGAIREALEMPEGERSRRSRALSRAAASNPPSEWLGSQVRDLLA